MRVVPQNGHYFSLLSTATTRGVRLVLLQEAVILGCESETQIHGNDLCYESCEKRSVTRTVPNVIEQSKGQGEDPGKQHVDHLPPLLLLPNGFEIQLAANDVHKETDTSVESELRRYLGW